MIEPGSIRPRDKDGRRWYEGDTAIHAEDVYLVVESASASGALCSNGVFYYWSALKKPPLDRLGIESKCGTQTVFDCGGGWPAQQVLARRHLTLGTVYTVQSIRIGGSMSAVTLAECPGEEFNTCLFGRERAALALLADQATRALAAFGAAALQAHRNDGEPGDVDGGTLQELAEKHGVLERRHVTEPCGEGCSCAYGGFMPGECYFVPAHISTVVKEIS